MTDEILSLMENRRIAEVKEQQQRYTEINNNIKQQCRQGKENWVTAECQEAARMDALNEYPVDLCSTWKSYAQLLFEDQREARQPINGEEWSGPECEVQHALKAMKNRTSRS
ncbi:hypothetical protein HUJ04_011678 [Dendroctonus ponderosae]|nr:hypothetical protein HUJ04_011678 [Dendroctonus ponderosae]